MQIKDLAIGDGYVYLMEGNTKVKFYALAHNYESGLNGNGRTLFCRESPPASGYWGTYDCHGNTTNSVRWRDGRCYSYLNSTYYNKFNSATKSFISQTKCYCYVGGYTGRGYVASISCSILALSATECYGGHGDASEILSSKAKSRLSSIISNFGRAVWSRTVSPKATAEDNNEYMQAGIAISASGLVDDYNNIASQYGYLPCFTLPATLYLDKDGFPTKNSPPEVTSDAGESGVALGEKNAPFDFSYTVTDADGDTLTVTEKLDGKTTKTRTGVASGTALTFEQAADAAGFQRILNGSHTLTLEVDDGKTTTEWTATFTKNVHAASVTLAEPLTVEGDITVAVLQVTGSIPDDAVFRAEVTNNANDPSPVWQDATTEVQKGVNIVFENKTATAGAAFNFRVSVSRGSSGKGGYIEAISGAFQ